MTLTNVRKVLLLTTYRERYCMRYGFVAHLQCVERPVSTCTVVAIFEQVHVNRPRVFRIRIGVDGQLMAIEIESQT
jgi:hypothetical protein